MHDDYCEDCHTRPAKVFLLHHPRQAGFLKQLCENCVKNYWKYKYKVREITALQKTNEYRKIKQEKIRKGNAGGISKT